MNRVQPYFSFTGEKTTDIVDANLNQLFESTNQLGTDVDNLGTLEIATFGPINMDLSISRTQNVLTHNLGYPPLFLVYLFNSAGNYFTPLPIVDWGSGFNPMSHGPTSFVQAWTDSQYLWINWLGSANTPAQSFYYFIFKNPAA